MRTHPHIPEIEKVEEYKDRLRKEFDEKFFEYDGMWHKEENGHCSALTAQDMKDWIISQLDPYVHFVDQIFKREELEGK